MKKGESSEEDHNILILEELFHTLPGEGKAEFIRYLMNTYPQLSGLLKELTLSRFLKFDEARS